MKRLQLSYTNQKGQIVIPKEYRDRLNIDHNVALLTKVTGNSIMITPVRTVITQANQNDSYFKILERTQGSWGRETTEEKKKEAERRKMELNAAKKGKKGW